MKFQPILGRAGGMCGVLGREKERGSEACWDRILEKNILGKHFRCKKIEKEPEPSNLARSSPVGRRSGPEHDSQATLAMQQIVKNRSSALENEAA